MKLLWLLGLVISVLLLKVSNSTTLTISGSEYTELPSIFGLYVTVIEIVYTNIQIIEDGAFSNVTNTLNELIIHENKLLRTIESKALYGLGNLNTLKITSSDSLNNLDQDLLKNLSSLQTLEITYSRSVQNIPSLDNLIHLETLDLTASGIEVWDENALSNNKNLRTIVLSQNSGLTFIPRESFSKQTKLTNLYFAFCKLSTLYPEYFDMSYYLDEIYGNGNPWDCSTMCDFLKWKDYAFSRTADLGTCVEPENVKGESVVQLSSDDLCGPARWVIIVAPALITVPTLFIMVYCADRSMKKKREKEMEKYKRNRIAQRKFHNSYAQPQRRTAIPMSCHHTRCTSAQSGARTTQQATPHTVDAVVQENEEAIYEEIVIATSNDENIYKITEDANTPRYEEIDATGNNEYVYTILKEASQQQMASTFNTTEMDNKAFQLNEDCVNVPPSVPEYEQI